jgi:septal ring factor EnvC (AmiA/AmiB activator)
MKFLALIIITLISCSQIMLAQAGFNKIFLASKGTWKYPVKQAYILGKNENCLDCNFSKGLTFVSDSSYPVHSVFDGVVVLVNKYDDVYIVITKYGDYFIGYSNLENAVVKKGDTIKTGNPIGHLGKTLDEIYSLDIALSKSDEELDASSWFVSKKPSQ